MVKPGAALGAGLTQATVSIVNTDRHNNEQCREAVMLAAPRATAPGRPRRAEVLAHVQRARERFTGELAGEAESDRIRSLTC